MGINHNTLTNSEISDSLSKGVVYGDQELKPQEVKVQNCSNRSLFKCF